MGSVMTSISVLKKDDTRPVWILVIPHELGRRCWSLNGQSPVFLRDDVGKVKDDLLRGIETISMEMRSRARSKPPMQLHALILLVLPSYFTAGCMDMGYMLDSAASAGLRFPSTSLILHCSQTVKMRKGDQPSR